ncbi:sulfatase-like hydrolase/transferase [Novosphingobium sp. FSY-8]|uniref:Sulfatase-like hydrolase/transferase n=2 Tax=Novosphingobium ovatum TaxID=1908523 RepID=A0ABW9X962_9SPHN|nr:sulfatase-like hydrolase/transferase [Novosphingobium ovatum]
MAAATFVAVPFLQGRADAQTPRPAAPASAKPSPTPVPAASAQPGRAASRPRNIIFVLVDDLRFDGMGFLQPGLLHTPNIDRMAREGTYFPNAVTTSSLCSPSRATILTGMTARNHGIVDNNDSSEAGLTFFPAYLQQAGYQTAYIGKWHMGQASAGPRAGFNRWISFRGQGDYYPTTGISPADIAAGKRHMLNVDGQEVAQKGYITDELTDYAMDWLERGRDQSKPFFLYLSHKGVHSDPLPPPRYAHQYDKAQFTLPASAANTPENYRGKPMWVYNQRNTWHGIDFFYNSDMKMTEYLKYYYGTLSAIDDSLGRIMTYLRKTGQDKDTLVVFTSDNGFQIGDHGLIDKRTAYEASVRVPLLIWEPGTVPAATVNSGRLRGLDFAPTFLTAAGVPTMPQQFEGQNAWGLLTGAMTPAQWNPSDFIYEYYWEWTFPQTPTTFAITRGNLKYIQYHGIYDRDELYDLAADPTEMHNLADDPAHVQDKVTLRRALYQQMANNRGQHMIPYSQRLSIGAVRRMQGGTGPAPFPAEWQVGPNRDDRMDDMMPDSPAKVQARAAGRPFMVAPTVDQQFKQIPQK